MITCRLVSDFARLIVRKKKQKTKITKRSWIFIAFCVFFLYNDT